LQNIVGSPRAFSFGRFHCAIMGVRQSEH